MARIVWSWIGVVAQVLFTAYWLVAPLWQGPHYSVLADSISDMYAVTAPACRVMVVVVTVCGAATIAFALLALRPAFRAAGWSALVGSLLLGLSIFGLGDLLTPFEQEACRIADAGCTPAAQVANSGGTLDSILSTAGIVLLVAAGCILFVALRKTPATRGFAIPVLVLAIATAVVFLVDGVGIGGIAGLLERMLALLGAAMIVVLAVAVIRIGRESKAD